MAASVYQNGNDIVIAFKGSDITLGNATVDWFEKDKLKDERLQLIALRT